MLETLWAFVLPNNSLLAGGRDCLAGGGDGLWASLGMDKLGVGTGLSSAVPCALIEVPNRIKSCPSICWSLWKCLVPSCRWI